VGGDVAIATVSLPVVLLSAENNDAALAAPRSVFAFVF